MRACSAFHDLGNCFSDYGDARKAFGISLFGLHFARNVLHNSVLESRALDCIGERVCCLLVLSLVSSTLPCIRRPKP
jgi:hypothetical protein